MNIPSPASTTGQELRAFLFLAFVLGPIVAVGGVSGYIVEATSDSTFFVLSALTVVPTLLLLAWLWRRIDPGRPADGGA